MLSKAYLLLALTALAVVKASPVLPRGKPSPLNRADNGLNNIRQLLARPPPFPRRLAMGAKSPAPQVQREALSTLTMQLPTITGRLG